MQKMYSKIGTPENCKEMEKEWNDRLTEIDDKLKAFQEAASHGHHLHSSSSNQVRDREAGFYHARVYMAYMYMSYTV